MLSNSSAEIAVNIAAQLVETNSAIAPKGSTLIAELTRPLLAAGSGINFFDKTQIADTLVTSSSGSTGRGDNGQQAYHVSEHDATMDNYIEDMAGLVTGYIGFAQGVVNKEVTAFSESFMGVVDRHRNRDAGDFFEVKYFTPHEIFSSDFLAGELAEHSPRGSVKYPESMSIPDAYVGDDLRTVINIGHPATDLMISSWYQSNPNARRYVTDSFSIEEMSLTLEEQLDYHLANYLFYRAVAEKADIPNGDSLTTIKRVAGINRDYHAQALVAAKKLYDMTIQQGRILSTSSQTAFSYLSENTYSLTIYNDSFTKAVEGGAGLVNIETIYGYLTTVGSGPQLTARELIANASQFNETWNRTRGVYSAYLNSTRLDLGKHFLRVTIENSLANLTEAEQEIANVNQGFIEETRKLAYAFIDKLNVDALDDVSCLALELVAGIRFRFSNAYEILTKMKAYLSDKAIDTNEAATFALIDTLVEYCLDQTTQFKS